ncbi:Pentatricopeptide repeat [Macleaya cordata]|uniref:Pentatricopeptide repeat n=1 Tax=Macleaya cordata TaxID=56857 RepID=A0A200PW82_MACCD|nr:Pentatricopeptide repeat [Macleaya cordata]
MINSGYLPNPREIKIALLLYHPSLFKSLTAFNNISELKQFHAHIFTSGLSKKIFTITRLLAFLAISNKGDLNYAKTLFYQIQNPNFFMFNTMIQAFSHTQTLQSIKFYVQMLRLGIHPDKFTFPFLFKSSSILSMLFLGQQLHTHVLKLGLLSDVFILNNSISMYSNCGELSDSRRLFHEFFGIVDVVSWTSMITGHSNSGEIDVARGFFDQMPVRNVVSLNAMISGYAKIGRIDEARTLFDNLPQIIFASSWSSMISGYSQNGFCREALELFNKMINGGIRPNESALVSAISACAQLRSLEEGEWIYGYIKEEKFVVNVPLGTALVDMYGKCGKIEKAIEVFNEMGIKNVMTWNSMISGLAMNGFGKEALKLFWRMQKMGFEPNSITFIGVLSGCSHSGLVDEGRRIFYNIMTCLFKIRPELEHYGCMVDLLGRAGLIKEALNFVEGMPVEPHPGLWGAIVGACRIHGELKVGEEIGKKLIEMEPNNSGRYALLSNIFAAAKRWDDVEIVRGLLKGRNVLKNPGNSLVETY